MGAEALVEAKRKRTQAEQAEVIALHARLHALEVAAGEMLIRAETTTAPDDGRSPRGQALPHAISAVRSALTAAQQPQEAILQAAGGERCQDAVSKMLRDVQQFLAFDYAMAV